MELVTSLPADTPLRHVAERVRRIEELGFDTVHISETVRDPFAVAALAIEHSSRLTVRTSMVVAFARSPMLTALSAWDLADFSGGRFQLGLATQVRGNIVGRYSMPWTDPVAQLRDYVGAVRAIFEAFRSGSALDYEGTHYTFNRLQPYFNPGPIDVPAPEIWTGGVNARMCALAGEVADGFVAHPTSSHPKVLAEKIIPALESGGRKPRIVAVPKVITGRDGAAVAAAREPVRKELAFLYSTPAYRIALDVLGFPEVGEKLTSMARSGDWADLAGVLTDDVLDGLITQCTYSELPEVLTTKYGSICDGVALAIPTDPADDEDFRSMCAEFRAAE
ncbi:TIGR03617 family F420-dependent LLM class oxidoreductase [Rhodococcus globerulus]|uniref:TIGR03617 family F420-dependent LLM class oxidoreductase n=1 Tax=Rhodococcus globerulus TaxID=33008 RepID=A0ABU4C334_RHOGO|nr:TIGR03617 family F420-dependent LLM class oxidoreductase [Rhodococcus globerulus]MDV6270914.1 TIGR03617 family F420-dependent LLM class oxidoreductase [Rhodococcus globerulus]